MLESAVSSPYHATRKPIAPCRSVLMVGTHLDGMGGVRAVVRGYLDGGLFERYDCVYVASHRAGSAWVKITTALKGWARVAFLLRKTGCAAGSRANGFARLVLEKIRRLPAGARGPTSLHRSPSRRRIYAIFMRPSPVRSDVTSYGARWRMRRSSSRCQRSGANAWLANLSDREGRSVTQRGSHSGHDRPAPARGSRANTVVSGPSASRQRRLRPRARLRHGRATVFRA